MPSTSPVRSVLPPRAARNTAAPARLASCPTTRTPPSGSRRVSNGPRKFATPYVAAVSSPSSTAAIEQQLTGGHSHGPAVLFGDRECRPREQEPVTPMAAAFARPLAVTVGAAHV